MNNQKRWQMNRMGFINFWLYDNEIFSFCDGKLMLRGQNASGKSITTQSFIPFILDGNRSPSRLDPFGSNDRKMEYYFLGNSDSDDVTGYLFLEFKKQDIEEYRTIGIGQRARRGKNDMSFWGFIILDGRRIGIDFDLTNKSRDRFIPLTKKELGNRLGSGNLLLDTQREYMTSVNKYLFGFPFIEQYEQFIQLLIKVRAPKLSKEFKPSKVYDILNDSLQTLTDDDLHTLVDAMEKMDDIEISLENYKKAYNDLLVICNEYQKYNTYILGLKAQNYRKAKIDADAHKKKCEQINKEIETLKINIQNNLIKNDKLNTEIIELTNKIKLFEDSDLTKKLQQRTELQKEIDKLDYEISTLNDKIKEKKSVIEKIEHDISNIDEKIDDLNYYVSKELRELDLLNCVALLSCNGEVAALAENAGNTQKHYLKKETDRIKATISKTLSRVRKGVIALINLDNALIKLDESEKSLYTAEQMLNVAKRKFEEKEREEISCRDSLIDAWYVCQSEYKEYLLDETDLKSVVELISCYSEDDTQEKYNNYAVEIYSGKSRVLYREIERIKESLRISKENIEGKTKELEDIKSKKEITPLRSEEIQTARKLLAENSIPFVSFYEAVDYSDDIDEKRRVLLEKQIVLSGMIDALVIPQAYRIKAFEIIKDYSDLIIFPKCIGHSDKGLFKISNGISDEHLINEIKDVLDSISYTNEKNALYVLSANGYFKNGLIEGYSSIGENDCVRYIGVDARRKLKQKLIAEKETEIEALKAESENLKLQKQYYSERLNVLENEYKNSPKLSALDRLLLDKKNMRYELDHCQRNYDDCESLYREAFEKKDKANREVVSACSDLPYRRNTESYKEAEGALESYEDSLDRLKDYIYDIIDRFTDLENLNNRKEDFKSYLHEQDINLIDKKREHHIKNSQIEDINNYINKPENIQRAEEMSKANVDLSQKQEELEVVKKQLACDSTAEQIRSVESERILEELDEKIRYEQILEMYFKEDLGLKLCDSFSEHINADTVLSLAEKAVKSLKKIESTSYNYDTAYSLLYAKYQKHSSSIASYGVSFEDVFDSSEYTNIIRKRQVITAVWNGRRYPIKDFCEIIKEVMEQTEILIQKKDRELFEDILSDTVSRKLTARISESRSWITDMSNLMQSMDTSMGLTFSLQWKPKKAEGGGQLGTQELEKLLTRDKDLLQNSDRERLAYHFRSKIKAAKQEAALNGVSANYVEMVRDAIDYRKWFEFKMFFQRTGENKNELTDRAFNRFSGGEKAMAMYIPLFAAVNAQYRKSEKADLPRIIALDEAFAGVDDKNISSMFKLVETLKFDYIMNSQALWGCYETVKSLRIAELLRPENSRFITVIFYHWNGKKKIPDE